MFRGTDAGILIHTKGVNLPDCESLQVTLKQGSKTLVKRKDELTVSPDSIECLFSREETFGLNPGMATIDVTGVINGKAFALPAETISVYATNRNEVIT